VKVTQRAPQVRAAALRALSMAFFRVYCGRIVCGCRFGSV